MRHAYLKQIGFALAAPFAFAFAIAVLPINPAFAAQGDDDELAAAFAPLAATLAAAEDTIVEEMNGVQRAPADIGGYYVPDPTKAGAGMRPSVTFNAALASLG